jgi:hypothetical protein
MKTLWLPPDTMPITDGTSKLGAAAEPARAVATAGSEKPRPGD